MLRLHMQYYTSNGMDSAFYVMVVSSGNDPRSFEQCFQLETIYDRK